MWGPGAEQGGIIQSSSCKLDLKEPYYRMSQPQPYAMAQDQQPHQQIHSQVSLPVIRIFFFIICIIEFLCQNIMVLIKSTRVSRSKQKIKRSINARFCRAFVYILLPIVMIVTIDWPGSYCYRMYPLTPRILKIPSSLHNHHLVQGLRSHWQNLPNTNLAVFEETYDMPICL